MTPKPENPLRDAFGNAMEIAERAAADCLGAYGSASSFGDERDLVPVIQDAIKEAVKVVRTERDILRDLVDAQDGLLVCYRIGSQSRAGKYIDAIAAAKAKLDKGGTE